ncbi:MAG: glycosyltransferase family A protein [Celeribacter sp.]|jgi:glycosyltransferase involved in cell wall biosynthesis
MRIAVGAITRRRPAMFAELLKSFVTMQRPAGTEITFVFAENDSETTLQAELDAFRAQVPNEVRFALEPRPGIPAARNKVLDMALEGGFDYLTFVDDDEIVRPDWLVKLIAGIRAHDCDLAGGPVVLIEPDETLSSWNQAVFDLQARRMRRRDSERRGFMERGVSNPYNIYTNNWCVRLDFVREHGVRFDESLRVTGGSDSRFSLDLEAKGGKRCWITEAAVEEPTPKKRLTLRYVYARARDQSSNSVRFKKQGLGRVAGKAFARLFEAGLNLIAAPFTRGRSLAKVAYKAGMASGLVMGALGHKSRHYDTHADRYHTEVKR